MSSRAAYAAVVESLLSRSRAQQNEATAEDVAEGDAADAPPSNRLQEQEEQQQQQRTREARVPEVTERLQRTLAEDAVRRLRIPDDRPAENVVALTAPELRLMGRCVSFGMKQTINGVSGVYYYTGLVSAVTATTVTLLYVNRYREGDFKAYREREKRASAAGAVDDFTDEEAAAGLLVLSAADTVARPRATASTEREADVSSPFSYTFSEVFSGAFGNGPARVPADPRGSLRPAVELLTGPDLYGLSAHERRADHGTPSAGPPRRWGSCGDSLGPLPCVTFLRKGLHDVCLARSPERDFYAAAREPPYAYLDGQCQRAFVRRYLVHVGQGATSPAVSLFAYLAERRAAWAEDRDAVRAVAQAELAELMKVDRAIAKERKRMRVREARREASLRDYHAPPGIFAETGFLYLTGLPQGTLLAAAAMLFFTCAFGANFVLPVTFSTDPVFKNFFATLSDTFMVALLVWIVTSTVTLFHALSMRVPSIANAPVLIVRGVSSVGAAVYAVLCMALISRHSTNEYAGQSLVNSGSAAMCAFYDTHECSGFYDSCVSLGRSSPFCAPCSPTHYYQQPCYSDVTDPLQRVLIPLFLFSIVIFLSAVHGLFLLLKLFIVGRAASISSHI